MLFRASCVALFAGLAFANVASADSLSNIVGGSAAITYEGGVTYNGFTFVGPLTLPGNILTKSLDATLTQSLDYTYDTLDYSSGIRLTEVVTTPVPVTSYSVELTTQGAFFFITPDAPSQVIVAGTVVTVVPPPVGATVTMLTNKHVRFDFAAPVSSFAVHIPVDFLSSAPGTFSMVQTAAVPLPSAALGGLALLGALASNRLRRDRTPATN